MFFKSIGRQYSNGDNDKIHRDGLSFLSRLDRKSKKFCVEDSIRVRNLLNNEYRKFILTEGTIKDWFRV